MEESIFLNTLLKKDALREGRSPRRKERAAGGRHFLKTLLQNAALREGRSPRNRLKAS